MLIPDHETAVDFLNYEAISATILELLKDNRHRALTIGIHGDWGAGKSSVLKMVESAIHEDTTVACLWFNGWAFQGFDDAKTVLIEATITELCRQRSTVGKVKEIGARLIKRVDWLKLARHSGALAFTLATGLPSPGHISTLVGSLRSLAGSVRSMSPDSIEKAVNDAASLLKPPEDRSVPEEIHEFREEFEKLLEEAKIEQLVVLIDDLDRCLPPTAIDTLEAIRLFLFVPKTAFIIGADEGMIEYAVRQHFPSLPLVSGPVPYARASVPPAATFQHLLARAAPICVHFDAQRVTTSTLALVAAVAPYSAWEPHSQLQAVFLASSGDSIAMVSLQHSAVSI